MTNTTWFITGMKTTRRLLQTPTNTVFATCCSPSTAVAIETLVSSPGILQVVELDVADEASVKSGTEEAIKLLDGACLNYMLKTAGIIRGDDRALSFKPIDLVDTILTDVIRPALALRYLLPAIKKSNRKVVMNMSSRLGSIPGTVVS